MIQTYGKTDTAYKSLEIAAAMLSLESETGVRYAVENTYFDYGQNWKWTTIVAHGKDGGRWQVLNPKEHGLITDGLSVAGIVAAVRMVQNGRYNPDRRRTA